MPVLLNLRPFIFPSTDFALLDLYSDAVVQQREARPSTTACTHRFERQRYSSKPAAEPPTGAHVYRQPSYENNPCPRRVESRKLATVVFRDRRGSGKFAFERAILLVGRIIRSVLYISYCSSQEPCGIPELFDVTN